MDPDHPTLPYRSATEAAADDRRGSGRSLRTWAILLVVWVVGLGVWVVYLVAIAYLAWRVFGGSGGG